MTTLVLVVDVIMGIYWVVFVVVALVSNVYWWLMLLYKGDGPSRRIDLHGHWVIKIVVTSCFKSIPSLRLWPEDQSSYGLGLLKM